MKVINLTPHAVTLVAQDGTPSLVIPASGQIARVSCETVVAGHIEVEGVSIPITHNVYGEVQNLPPQTPGTIYVVSSLVANCVPYRADVLIPNESVRDSGGFIIGCKSLGKV